LWKPKATSTKQDQGGMAASYTDMTVCALPSWKGANPEGTATTSPWTSTAIVIQCTSLI